MKFISTLVIALLLSMPIGFAKTEAASHENYLIILDAGSTGTRMHLFAYHMMKDKHIKSIHEIKYYKLRPGVSSFAQNPSGVRSYLQKLFIKVDPYLTSKQKKQTPIYLFATAGMRNLPDKQQAQVMKAIQQAMLSLSKQYGYALPSDPRQAFTMIKGQYEGVFGWLTVNYLMNRLNEHSIRRHSTFGVLDLGGASSQITFQTNKKINPTYHVQLLLNQKPVELYAYSYPVYGYNEARQLVTKDDQEKSKVCFPSSQVGNFPACVTLIKAKTFLPSKDSKCAQLYGASSCNKLGEQQPSIKHAQFIGISNYYPVLNILGLTGQISSLPQLKKRAMAYCSTSLNHLEKKYPSTPPEKLKLYCFNAAWIYVMLHGYGFKSDTPFITTKLILGTSSAWPLGAAIYLLTQPESNNGYLLQAK